MGHTGEGISRGRSPSPGVKRPGVHPRHTHHSDYVVPVQTMKAWTLAQEGSSGEIRKLAALLPETRSPVVTAYEGRWAPRCRSGRFGEDRSLLLLPNIGPRTVKPSAQSVKQWLRHDGSNVLLGVNINCSTSKTNLNIVKMRVYSCAYALIFMWKCVYIHVKMCFIHVKIVWKCVYIHVKMCFIHVNMCLYSCENVFYSCENNVKMFISMWKCVYIHVKIVWKCVYIHVKMRFYSCENHVKIRLYSCQNFVFIHVKMCLYSCQNAFIFTRQ